MDLEREISYTFLPSEVLTEPQCSIIAAEFGSMTDIYLGGTGVYLGGMAYEKLETNVHRDKIAAAENFSSVMKLMKGVKTRNFLRAVASYAPDVAKKLLDFIIKNTYTRERFDKSAFITPEKPLEIFAFNVSPERILDKVACRQLLMHVPADILFEALEVLRTNIVNASLFNRITAASPNSEAMLRAFLPDKPGITPTSLAEFVGRLYNLPGHGRRLIISAFLHGDDSYRHYVKISKDVKFDDNMLKLMIDAKAAIERSAGPRCLYDLGMKRRFLEFHEYRGLVLPPCFDVWCVHSMRDAGFSLRRVIKSIEIVDSTIAGRILELLNLPIGSIISKTSSKSNAVTTHEHCQAELSECKSKLTSIVKDCELKIASAINDREYYVREFTRVQGERKECMLQLESTQSELKKSNKMIEDIRAQCRGENRLSMQYISLEELTGDEVIGQGSFGQVKRMRWRGAEVAVKFIELPVSDKTAEKEAADEANLLVQLRHPCIADFYGVLKHANTYGIVMGYCSRGTLANYLKQVQLNDKRRIDIARDIASGVWYLHANNVVHRDIKSGNVMIDESDRCKIIDFGLSKMRDHLGTIGGVATRTSVNVVGTTLWMAPEIITHEDSNAPVPYNKSTDMYAVGITLWEVASQKLPYAFAKGNLAIIVTWKAMNKFDEIPADTPPQLMSAIENLRLGPEQRWSAEQVYGVLTQ